MVEKIVMGPEALVLDSQEFPIVFGTVEAVKKYRESLRKAQEDYNEQVARANEKLKNQQREALEEVKQSLGVLEHARK